MSAPHITEPRDRRTKKYRAKHAALRAEVARVKPQSEDDLHKAVVEYLTLALPPSAVFLHIPNEGKRGWKAQAALKWNGTLKGAPDLLIQYAGQSVWIELKANGRKLSPAQKAVQSRLMGAGASVFVCYSVQEVEYALHDAAIPLRARVRDAA